MQSRKNRRRVWMVLAWLFLCLVIAVITLPLWFPLVLRPVARKAGATYSTYQREGYARFRLSNVVYSNGPALVRVETIEALTPAVWMARLALANTRHPFARATDWHYTIVTNWKTSRPA